MTVLKALAPAGGAALGSGAAVAAGHGLWAVAVIGVIGVAATTVHLIAASWRRMAERSQYSKFPPDVRRDLIDLKRAEHAPVYPPPP